jgi:hypothetical protein
VECRRLACSASGEFGQTCRAGLSTGSRRVPRDNRLAVLLRRFPDSSGRAASPRDDKHLPRGPGSRLWCRWRVGTVMKCGSVDVGVRRRAGLGHLAGLLGCPVSRPPGREATTGVRVRLVGGNNAARRGNIPATNDGGIIGTSRSGKNRCFVTTDSRDHVRYAQRIGRARNRLAGMVEHGWVEARGERRRRRWHFFPLRYVGHWRRRPGTCAFVASGRCSRSTWCSATSKRMAGSRGRRPRSCAPSHQRG